jgi:hypothetical protein
VLSFGFTVSPLIFSKVMRLIITHLRWKGHRIQAYLNNFISLTRIKSHLLCEKFLQLNSTYISEEVKSGTTTKKEVLRANSEHNGVRNVLYSSEKEIQISEDLEIINKSKSTTSVRKVARVAGLCISLSKVVKITKFTFDSTTMFLKYLEGISVKLVRDNLRNSYTQSLSCNYKALQCLLEEI